MAFREVSVIEVREVLRAWMGGKGLRRVAEQAGVDRKTVRRYVEAGQAAGLVRDGGVEQLSDELVGQVVGVVWPVRAGGHGSAWQTLEPWREQIGAWVRDELTIVKIQVLLQRRGVVVPYRTLHRFATERCEFGKGRTTVPVADGDPGVECQVDFGKLGLVYDPSAGRRRTVHALVFTAVYSRHMFVWLTFSQTLTALVAGCEAAWRFFGGVFGVLIPDNASAIVSDADRTNPQFTVGWLEYAQATGFATDAARVRRPRDKPRVERAINYVQENFFAGEEFVDLADAQARAETWCSTTAGLRVHGSTRARPVEVFAEFEAGVLLPEPERAYVVPTYATVKVHRDFHVQLDKALYSAPKAYIGQQVAARADDELVKLFYRGQLIKTHPRQRPGGRSTDAEDLPAEKVGYAMRDLDRLIANAAEHGQNVGIYAERLLDDKLPWTRMRQVYRLLSLARRYGSQPLETACARALELDVVNVTKISSMLERATENSPTPPPRAANSTSTARFARDSGEYAPTQPVQLRLIEGGKTTNTTEDQEDTPQ